MMMMMRNLRNLSTVPQLALRALKKRCREARVCSYQSAIERDATFLSSVTSRKDIAGVWSPQLGGRSQGQVQGMQRHRCLHILIVMVVMLVMLRMSMMRMRIRMRMTMMMEEEISINFFSAVWQRRGFFRDRPEKSGRSARERKGGKRKHLEERIFRMRIIFPEITPVTYFV